MSAMRSVSLVPVLASVTTTFCAVLKLFHNCGSFQKQLVFLRSSAIIRCLSVSEHYLSVLQRVCVLSVFVCLHRCIDPVIQKGLRGDNKRQLYHHLGCIPVQRVFSQE